MRFVALIPARAGSKRVPGKNIRKLAGHPLVAYTIAAAQQSGVFSDILISTDDLDFVRAAHAPFANSRTLLIERPKEFARDDSPDIDWVRNALSLRGYWNAFAILRPTSPFRTAETIQRAHKQFLRDEVHSIRAVQLAKEHPGKQWFCNGPGYPMTPVCDAKRSDGVPWHSCPTQTLPLAYVQNASLEMAWTYVLESYGSISGRKVAPFLTEGNEGFDINTEADWEQAEELQEFYRSLPEIHAKHSTV